MIDPEIASESSGYIVLTVLQSLRLHGYGDGRGALPASSTLTLARGGREHKTTHVQCG